MSRRALSSQLAATAAAGLLALTTTTVAVPAYGAPIDSALAPATSNAPIALMAYGADTAANTANAGATAVADAAANTGYDAFWQALPTWPTLTVGLDIPGVFNGFDNLFGWTFWNYGLGFSIGNDGPLGIQEWAPSNPFFDVVAESMGTTQGEWPGVGSLVGLLTPMGGFTNIESYANWYDPTGTTCLICNTFTLLGPDNTDLFSWTTNIPIGGLPQFELTTPLASFGPALGNAFDVSPLANGFDDPPAMLSSMASAPAQLVNDLTSTLSASLGPTIDADVSALLTSLSADVSTTIPNLLAANLAADAATIPNLLAANLAADAATIIPTLLASLIP